MSPVAVCEICGARAWVKDYCGACHAHECERYDCDNAADDEHRHCDTCTEVFVQDDEASFRAEHSWGAR